MVVARNAAALGLLLIAAPALAQTGLEGRVGKLEGEMRAVQRRVFPGGAGAMVEPQIAPQATPAETIGAPSSSALADLTQRVTALESQQRSLTGEVEQLQYKLRQLDEGFAAYRKATDARFGAGVPAPNAATPASRAPAGDTEAAAETPPPATPSSVAAAGDTRASVERPDTGDAAEDAYTYGYRLWAAKRYPEAEAQLKKVVATYPKHRRASFAQNLLGRSYLDGNKPSLASIAFYDNYKKFPDGERAPESLYYLGQALTKLNKPADACKVYGELTDVYAGKIDAAMRGRIATARAAAKCQ